MQQLTERAEEILRKVLQEGSILKWPKGSYKSRMENVEVTETVPEDCVYSDGSSIRGGNSSHHDNGIQVPRKVCDGT